MRKQAGLVALSFLAFSSANAAADVVYDCSGPRVTSWIIHDREFPESPGFGESSSFQERTDGAQFEFDSRIGDAISLAGTARFVTSFQVHVGGLWLLSSQAAKCDVSLTLYTLSGGLPSSEIWTGTVADVVFPAAIPGWREVTVTFAPNVTVPDNIAYAFAFTSITGEETGFGGVYTNDAPQVGTSTPGFLLQETATQAWRAAGAPANLRATVNAVPAPASVLALAAGLQARRRGRR